MADTSPRPTPPVRGASRNAGLINLAIAAAVLAVVVPLALVASQQPPPAIAEFAPQAQHPIKPAPNNQGGNLGDSTLTGEAGAASPSPSPGAAGTAPSPTPSPIDVARVRQCVGDRQTEDPQSPPCVPYFAGDNGGATYNHGVTATDIHIGYPYTLGDATNIAVKKDFETYFNQRFETYGRHVHLDDVVPSTPFGHGADTQSQQRDAAGVVASNVLMSMSYVYTFGEEKIYYDALARQGVMGTDWQPGQGTEEDLAAHAPLQWKTRVPTLDRQERYLGSFLCTTLANQPPRFAPAQTSLKYPQGPPVRRFALVSQRNVAALPNPDLSALTDALSACGNAAVVVDQVDDSSGNKGQQALAYQKVVQDIIAADATTVICIGDGSCYQNLMQQASAQQRHPEWVITSYGDSDWDQYMQVYFASDQANSIVGLSWFNKWLPVTLTPWYQALRSVDPNFQPQSGYYEAYVEEYEDLLLIMSGIQMAGPNLNPTSFARGLHGARFSNPGAGSAPYYQATVGFGPGDFAFFQDAALVWWNSSAPSIPTGGKPGTFCYAGHGVRGAPGRFPHGDAIFGTIGASGTCPR